MTSVKLSTSNMHYSLTKSPDNNILAGIFNTNVLSTSIPGRIIL